MNATDRPIDTIVTPETWARTLRDMERGLEMSKRRRWVLDATKPQGGYYVDVKQEEVA